MNVWNCKIPLKIKNLKKQAGPRRFCNKQGWRTIGGKSIYFRSAWEFKYATYLEFLKIHREIADWFYEPQTFWFEGIKRGVCSYKPDFKVLKADGTHFWVEVKGYLDSKSKTKLKRFKQYFPQEEIKVIDKAWFNREFQKNKFFLGEDKSVDGMVVK